MKKHGLLKHYAASQILVAALCFGTGCSLLASLSIRADVSNPDSECTGFNQVCEKSSAWSSIRDCPVNWMPSFIPGCRVEKEMVNGCPVTRLRCDNGGSSASSTGTGTNCPIPAPQDLFIAGCKTVRDGVGTDGCPLWKTICEDKSSSASSSSLCPIPMTPVGPGCKMEKGEETNGCPTWKMVCAASSSSLSSKRLCPMPSLIPGCRMEQGNIVDGCPTWNMSCGSASSSQRSCPEPKSMDGLGFGCHVLREKSVGCDAVTVCIDPPPSYFDSLKKKRSSSSFPNCPSVEVPELPIGCGAIKSKDERGCTVWIKQCTAEMISSSSAAATQESSSDGGRLPEPPAGFEEPIAPMENIERPKSWFSDLSTDDAVGQAANELADRGIIGGYEDGTFRANQTVNRAEAAKFLILAKYGNFDSEIPNNGKFKDVQDGQWYTKYVLAAAMLNIIAGNPDGTFRPGNPVNTAEFLKMLTLTFSMDLNMNYDFQDVRNEDWFSAYAGVAQQYGLFPNRGSYLEPERAMTRGEAAYAISRILNR